MKTLKPLLFLFLLFTIPKNTVAQNLINNSSFEEAIDDCNGTPLFAFFNDGCFNVPLSGVPNDGWSWGAASGKPSGIDDGFCHGFYSAVFAANYHIPNGETTPFYNGSSIVYTFANNLEPGDYTLSFCYEGDLSSTLNTNLAVKVAKNLQNVDPQNPFEIYYEAYDDQTEIIPRTGIPTIDIGDPEDEPVLHHVNKEFSSTFTINENQSFDQLWFYGIPTGEGQSKICIDDLVLIKCDEDITCQENLNLTSCSLNNQTGYIDLWCGVGNSYSLESPQGSDPITYNCNGHFLITNATAGTYTVFIESQNGCRYSRTYEVIENCCVVENDCLPPENLSCFTLSNTTTLHWDPVPGAIEYQLYIYAGECGGPSLSVEIITLEETSINRNLIDARSFEWAVRTVCADESLSDFSELVCFDIDACNSFSEGFSESANDNTPSQKSIIFPNPNDGNFLLELSDYNEKNFHSEVKIFNQTGVLVFQKKVDQAKTSLDLKIVTPGIYFAVISIDGKIITEKFVVQ